jgi:DNA-binding transcriptional ArsR family regulator
VTPGSRHAAARAKRAGGEPAQRRVAGLERNAVRVAALLKAIANPARLVVLCQLAEGERSVRELERVVGLSQSGISQHLAVLRRGGVVKSRRHGQAVLYSLADRDVVTLMDTLYALFCRRSGARGGARLRVGAV